MLKKHLVPLLIFLLCSCSSDDDKAPAMQSTVISSPSFEQALIDIGIDSDGVLNGTVSTADISEITFLPLNDANISSLVGLEKFTGLKKLEIFNNQLTTLDVSQNTALKELNFSGNLISTIDVSQNTALTSLVCFDNQLTSLDVSQNTLLATLACTNNNLTSIDVSSNINLTQLYCSQNQLTSIDVSSNTAIQELFCFENLITNLDLSQNIALKELYCHDNQLTSLDIKNGANAILLEFNAMGNIDLSCIQLDNENEANLGQAPYGQWFKDATAAYAENCTAP